MKTEHVVAEMLTENTGRHMLDSGGAYGRHWERNQGRDFSKEAESTVSFRYGEIELTHNVYHWIQRKLDYCEETDRLFHELYRTEVDADDSKSWLELMEEFPAWLAKHLAKVEDEPEDWQPAGIYGEGEPITINTYNEENFISQTLQFVYFTIDDGYRSRRYGREEFVILQVHGGCDVRGGYTRPRVFTCSDELSALDYRRGSVYCSGENPWFYDANQVTIPGVEKRENCDGQYWFADGSSFGDQGAWGRSYTALEDYETVRIVGKDEETDDDSSHEWVPGKLCYVQDDTEIHGTTYPAGTGFCPKCGCVLKASID